MTRPRAGTFIDVYRDRATAIRHFTSLVGSLPASIDAVAADPTAPSLGELVTLIGATVAPHEVDVEATLARFDGIAAAVGEQTVDGVRRRLFDDLGFAGNSADYYSLDNSRLDLVVDRRVGIPITLGIVMVEVGRRVGVPLHLCALPGHVVVGDGARRWYDAFDGGRPMDAHDCQELVSNIDLRLRITESDLEPTPPQSILIRVLNNMVAVASRDHHDLVYPLLQLRSALPDMSPRERVLLGRGHAEAGDVVAASDQLEAAAAMLDGDDARSLEAEAARYLARLN